MSTSFFPDSPGGTPEADDDDVAASFPADDCDAADEADGAGAKSNAGITTGVDAFVASAAGMYDLL